MRGPSGCTSRPRGRRKLAAPPPRAPFRCSTGSRHRGPPRRRRTARARAHLRIVERIDHGAALAGRPRRAGVDAAARRLAEPRVVRVDDAHDHCRTPPPAVKALGARTVIPRAGGRHQLADRVRVLLRSVCLAPSSPPVAHGLERPSSARLAASISRCMLDAKTVRRGGARKKASVNRPAPAASRA